MQTAKIKLLYFASLGDVLGTNEETYTAAVLPKNVGELITLLANRGESWRESLAATTTRCAVNQVLAKKNTAIKNGDEIAFFPPVTGG